MPNASYETTMRVAFANATGNTRTPLGRLIRNKLKAGVGIRWPRRKAK